MNTQNKNIFEILNIKAPSYCSLLNNSFAKGLNEVGGFETMRDKFTGAAANYTYLDQALYGNRSCGFPPEDSFHLFRSATDSSFPWTGMIFGLTILGTNAWCTDQVLASYEARWKHR